MQIDSSVRPSGGTGMPRSDHELAQQRRRLGMRDGRLHADAHEAVRVVDRAPVDARELVNRVAAADVVRREIGAAVDEQLHDLVAALVRRAHQRRAALRVVQVHVEPEVEEHRHRLEVRVARPLVRDAFDPADPATRP